MGYNIISHRKKAYFMEYIPRIYDKILKEKLHYMVLY